MKELLLERQNGLIPMSLARMMGSGTRLVEPATLTVVRRWRTEREVPVR